MLRNLKGHPLRYASSAASSFTEVNFGVASVAGLEYAPLNSEEAVGKGHPHLQLIKETLIFYIDETDF